MEEKIVGNKKEDLPSLDLFHSLISIASLIYLSIYLVCVQSTTPLWFTDILSPCLPPGISLEFVLVYFYNSCILACMLGLEGVLVT